MMEGSGGIMALEEIAKYKMAGEGKIPGVKIEPGRNNKIIIRIPYNQDVSVHSLRHSFATYFLESEVNLRYIQEFPGHKSLKTIKVYTHVSKKIFLR